MEQEDVWLNNTGNEILDFVVATLEDKRAKDIKVLYVRDLTLVSDYFVICSGTSTTHIKALADELEERLEAEKDIRLNHKEGYNSARWILMDYNDIIVHIFHQDDRAFYNLERIWADAKDVLEQGKERVK